MVKYGVIKTRVIQDIFQEAFGFDTGFDAFVCLWT